MAASLATLVTDWGGFEEFVKELNRTGSVSVERNVALTDRNGSRRQIDVVIRHREGLVDHLVLGECKYWKRRVTRRAVENLVAGVAELRADRGMIFTTVGYQSGALPYAQANGIEIYLVREVTDEEWGSPGRIAIFNQRYISRAIGDDFNLQVLSSTGPPPNIALGNMTFDVTPTRHEILVAGAPPITTLEEVLDTNSRAIAGKAVADFSLSPPELIFGGHGGDRLFALQSTLGFPQLMQFVEYPQAPIGTLTYQLGILIQERHLRIDRGDAFTFAIALEDCVKRTVTTATRRPGQETTSMVKIEAGATAGPTPGDLSNDTLFVMWVNFVSRFDRFKGLEFLKIYDFPATSPSEPLSS
jgi:hypothetical protein